MESLFSFSLLGVNPTFLQSLCSHFKRVQQTVICEEQISDVQAEKKDTSGRRGERQKRLTAVKQKETFWSLVWESTGIKQQQLLERIFIRTRYSVSALCQLTKTTGEFWHRTPNFSGRLLLFLGGGRRIKGIPLMRAALLTTTRIILPLLLQRGYMPWRKIPWSNSFLFFYK